MPSRAEVGSTKHVANRMKAAGLQRLCWYCQRCQRQMRDGNGFKQHTLSESHVRQMLLVQENPQQIVRDLSQQFKHDFLKLLRTSHNQKMIDANHFYQEYIQDRHHIHLHSTTWDSLTDFVKHLGREGLCQVEDGERGLSLAWIDRSPETLRKRDILRKRKRQDRGDEQREQEEIAEQVRRAKMSANSEEQTNDLDKQEPTELRRGEDSKMSIHFAPKKQTSAPKPLLQKSVFKRQEPQIRLAPQERPTSETERIMKLESRRKRMKASTEELHRDEKRSLCYTKQPSGKLLR